MKSMLMVLLAILGLMSVQAHDDHDDFLKVGTIGFLKIEHHHETGVLSVQLFSTDKKTIITADSDIVLSAAKDKEKKSIVLVAKEQTYTATDDFLKAEITGKFTIKIKEKQYIVKLEDHHHH